MNQFTNALRMKATFTILVSIPVHILAQTSATSSTAIADSLFRAERWADAAKEYEQVVRDNPGNSQAWQGLGMSRYSLKEYDKAVDALQRLNSLAPNAVTMYNIACSCALNNKKDEAIEWLGKAVDNGLPPTVNPATDSDLKSLTGDPRFSDILNRLDRKRNPCLYSAEARQFDFWIGHWDVYNPAGRKAGTSVIEQASVGCAILENWTDFFGGNGRSLNFYDPGTQKWYQYWIGRNGIPTRYSGNFSDGAMRYLTDPVQSGSQILIQRLTFFRIAADTVRQFAEKSVDGGKSWSVAYDFRYVRKK